jgi:hypothetical protein
MARPDGRRADARRLNHIVKDLTQEIGGSLTRADAALVRQAGLIMLQAERMEANLLNGEAIPNKELIGLANVAVRLLSAIRDRQRSHPASILSIEEHLGKNENDETAS